MWWAQYRVQQETGQAQRYNARADCQAFGVRAETKRIGLVGYAFRRTTAVGQLAATLEVESVALPRRLLFREALARFPRTRDRRLSVRVEPLSCRRGCHALETVKPAGDRASAVCRGPPCK